MSAQQHVVILGAGPAGLTAAYELTQHDVPVTVLERDAIVGGIARTEWYNGYGYDIGGHRFYTKMPEVDRLWHEVLGKNLLRVPRLSRIHYQGNYFYYPLRLGNVLSVLGPLQSTWMTLSYLHSRLMPHLPEENFEDYVSNRFGKRLYYLFFKTYTEKVWGIPTTEIRAEWAAQRIRGLSFTSVLGNALFKNGNGNIKSLIESFEYPTLGPGMMWNAFTEAVQARGGEVLLEAPVSRVHRRDTQITGVTIRQNGAEREIAGTAFISSLALRDLMQMLDPSPPIAVLNAANGLKYRDFLTVVLIVDAPDLFPDNWLYIHTAEVHVGRIQNYKNWSKAMLPDPTKSSLGMEYFVNEGDALWTRPDAQLIEMAKRELEYLGIAQADAVVGGTVKRMTKAYPVYDADYRENLNIVRGYLNAFGNLQTVGRNGLHKYNNQDHSMMTGLLAARNLLGEHHDLWAVNTDMDYQEEIRVDDESIPAH